VPPTIRNIKLTLRFDGTDYAGWQFQKNAVSIQEVVQKALKKTLGERVTVVGCGRTDAGVHAKALVANFKTRSTLPCGKIRKALNSSLPRDIIISACAETGPRFNAQFSAKKKLYCYAVSTAEVIDPFHRRFVAHYPYKLNLVAMKKAAKALAGRHDFKAFENKPERERCTVRRIHKIGIEKKRDVVYIYIEADGFLRNMARNIVGTLLEIGRGKFSAGNAGEILAKRQRRYCGFTAPARGLCLERVSY
jgi:tRNA pseudouridine38-40 synthase